jgi:hypothetical protein
MRISVLSLFICIKAFSSLPLLENYDKAKEIGLLYERPLALLFLSDEDSKGLEELIQSEEFSKAIENECIFVKIPLGNEELRSKFNVGVSSLFILMDNAEEEITRMAYQGESPKSLAKQLKSKIALYQTLLLETDKEVDEERLKEVYKKADELGSLHQKEKILEKGMKLSKGLFFFMERYVSLVNEGKKESIEAKWLREKMLEMDQEDREESRLRLALIDFQEGQGNPEEVVAPLCAYLEEFGEKDAKVASKLHRIILEYLLTQQERHLSFKPS